jgi:hypothetical protein
MGLGIALGSIALVGGSDAGPAVVSRPLAVSLTMPDTVLAWRADPPPRLSAAIAIARSLARELRVEASHP